MENTARCCWQRQPSITVHLTSCSRAEHTVSFNTSHIHNRRKFKGNVSSSGRLSDWYLVPVCMWKKNQNDLHYLQDRHISTIADHMLHLQLKQCIFKSIYCYYQSENHWLWCSEERWMLDQISGQDKYRGGLWPHVKNSKVECVLPVLQCYQPFWPCCKLPVFSSMMCFSSVGIMLEYAHMLWKATPTRTGASHRPTVTQSAVMITFRIQIKHLKLKHLSKLNW